jgi:hypothetical protein
VGEEGVEPSWAQGPPVFETGLYTIPALAQRTLRQPHTLLPALPQGRPSFEKGFSFGSAPFRKAFLISTLYLSFRVYGPYEALFNLEYSDGFQG